MGRLRLLDKKDATEEVRPIYEEIEKVFGRVPNIFKTYAHFPPLLKANWEKFKVLMVGGSLRRELKEAIALVVSDANACQYCIAAHGLALQQLGFTRESIDALVKSLEGPGFEPKELKILEVARKSTKDASSVTDQEIEKLRKLGWSESEIIEAQGVMELFTGFNKFLDSLGVDVDF
ncbi:MAG: peroxidase-related enzyme [Deltaproteobacteria bacterium]|nr:peroxidase-related enzyme [Deltaproteobacteria bacterium]